jgi:pyruvate/2-oxoglutarate dehydrogenase complex dihydrolipoamide dehydrogenase (E3) component
MTTDHPAVLSDRRDQDEFLRRVRPASWTNPTPRPLYDLVILGAGPAGLAAAEIAIRLDLTVALVERDRLGGNSLNTGSIASKAIVRSAKVLGTVRDAHEFGGRGPIEPAVDFAAVMERMRRVRTRIAEYCSIDRLRAQGVDVFFGDARFTGPKLVMAGDAVLRFNKALIATGARPRPSNIPGLDQIGYLTSGTIFDITALPKRLAIIGGGPLGCESAQAFRRLGSRVTIVQNDPKFLSHEGRDAAELVSMSMSRDGVETRLNTTVVGARMDQDVKILDTINNEVKDRIEVDEILLSIGRIPNVEDLGLEAAGIGCGPDARVTVDDYLCTTNSDVYAAGDICMTHQFANVAEATGRMAVENAFGRGAHGRPRHQRSHLTIPWCTFCDPEIAHVGMQVWEARRRSIPATTFTVMMQDVDRAITDGEDGGFVKILVKDGTDEILGATIVASRASEMINEMSVVMSAGIGMADLADVLHTYPAQSEAIRSAAMAFVRARRA